MVGHLLVACNAQRTSSAFLNNIQIYPNGSISGYAGHYLIPGEYVIIFGKEISCN